MTENETLRAQGRGNVLNGKKGQLAEFYLTDRTLTARKRKVTLLGILAALVVIVAFFALAFNVRGPGMFAYAPAAIIGSLGGGLGFFLAMMLTSIVKGPEGILFEIALADITEITAEKKQMAVQYVIKCAQQPEIRISLKKEVANLLMEQQS